MEGSNLRPTGYEPPALIFGTLVVAPKYELEQPVPKAPAQQQPVENGEAQRNPASSGRATRLPRKVRTQESGGQAHDGFDQGTTGDG